MKNPQFMGKNTYMWILFFSFIITVMLFTEPVSAKSLPNFAAIEPIAKRQQMFFAYLLPDVNLANEQILHNRVKIKQLKQAWQDHADLKCSEKSWLTDIAQQYRIKDFAVQNKMSWQQLLKRVDIVPTSMVLAQAANESAWGTSRFAQKGANFFGQWCYRKGCGLVPLQRTAGQRHEVQTFANAAASVRAYMRNLNTHTAYSNFRRMRVQLRKEGKQPNGMLLAEGLVGYSARGEIYVKSIRSIIQGHNLIQFDIA